MNYDSHCLAYRVQLAVNRAKINGAMWQMKWIKEGKRPRRIH